MQWSTQQDKLTLGLPSNQPAVEQGAHHEDGVAGYQERLEDDHVLSCLCRRGRVAMIPQQLPLESTSAHAL